MLEKSELNNAVVKWLMGNEQSSEIGPSQLILYLVKDPEWLHHVFTKQKIIQNYKTTLSLLHISC